jgi:hypothetical protein
MTFKAFSVCRYAILTRYATRSIHHIDVVPSKCDQHRRKDWKLGVTNIYELGTRGGAIEKPTAQTVGGEWTRYVSAVPTVFNRNIDGVPCLIYFHCKWDPVVRLVPLLTKKPTSCVSA